MTGQGSKRARRARAADPGTGRKGEAGSPSPEADPRIALFEQAHDYASYIGVEAHGGRFLVATSDRAVGQHLFVKQGRPEFRVLGRAVRVVEILTGDDAIAGRLFVDVGANIGTTTVHALVAQRFGSAVSCEPEEENYRLLRANVALNDLEEQVRTLPVAVSSRVGSSELVVLEGRRGASWIAVDRGKVQEAEAVRASRIAEDAGVLTDPHARAPGELAEMTVVDVEVVTLDRLVKTGIIDADLAAMVWIDAEGHEGHILGGASTLADRGVPIVFEFHPKGLEERGDRDKVHSLAEECYTHFVDVRRQESDQPRFQLRPVTELRPHGDRLLDPASPGRFTDLLLLHLDAKQARIGENLPELFAQQRSGVPPGHVPDPDNTDDGARRNTQTPGRPDPSSSVERDVPGPLVAFVHIPKTAGATVASMLAAAYSRRALHDAGNYISGPEKTARKVKRRPGGWERWSRRGGRVTVGHVPYGLFREHLPADTRYITFLREPVDRVLSHYYRHIHLTGTFQDQRRQERGLVVTASLEEAVGMQLPEINNLATRLLCRAPSPFGDIPSSALDDAKASLREFACVGLQERFDESVVLLQRALGLGLIPYMSRHVSIDRPAVDEISDQQRALVAEANQLDAELYSFAQGLFEDAVAASNAGFVADVEALRAASEEVTDDWVEEARDWLDRELPAGSTKQKAALFEAAEAAGVSVSAVKQASTSLSVRRERDQAGRSIWIRPEDAQAE